MPNKEHWLSKVQPLGSSRVEIPFRRTFTLFEADRLRGGLWPQDMDDKWIVYLGDSSLDMWRSWTGCCIFSLAAQRDESGVTVGPLCVNGDMSKYRRQSDAEDIRMVESLIGKVLSI